MYRALLLTGVTGVGKSTIAQAAGRLLTSAGRATAVVDTDALAQFGPRPADAGFYDRLKCTNLAAVWPNFKKAGARLIVVAAGVESAAVRDLYAECLAECELQVVRLVADEETVRRRLVGRGTPQAGGPAVAVGEDFTVANDRPPPEVAAEILVRAGWPIQSGNR